ncbi:hypothetical protein RJD39_18945 [Vibrio scophthalmi]|uniref:hypothetical protein n=1 Tax=Vibrio scophthalmi TaxID=45658 RepID=UPI00387330F6
MNTIIKVCMPLGFAFLPLTTAAESLCPATEQAVFSCEIGTKAVAACLAEDGKVSYRYGTQTKLELQLDEPVLSTGGCSGGGTSRLRFANGDYSYIVYDVMCNAEKIGPAQWSKTDYAGLMVLKGNKLLANKECTDYSAGILGVNTSKLRHVKKEEYNYDLL